MPAPLIPAETVAQNADRHFAEGLFCAESVLMAVAEAHGIESALLPRIATAFCSGMSRTCGPCGAVTGGVMGIGLVLGRNAAGQAASPVYAVTQTFVRSFEQTFGSRDCQTLLDGCDLNTPEGQAAFKHLQLRSRCRAFTRKAAELVIEAMATHSEAS